MNLIVATDLSGGIGKHGGIPWKCSEDLKNFRRLTSGCVVIMGSMTWESIGRKPLPNRVNIVLTSRYKEGIEGKLYFLPSIERILEWHGSHKDQTCFIIGGAGIYSEFIRRGLVKRIYLTCIHDVYDCDVFFDRTLLLGYRVRHTEETIEINRKMKNASYYELCTINYYENHTL